MLPQERLPQSAVRRFLDGECRCKEDLRYTRLGCSNSPTTLLEGLIHQPPAAGPSPHGSGAASRKHFRHPLRQGRCAAQRPSTRHSLRQPLCAPRRRLPQPGTRPRPPHEARAEPCCVGAVAAPVRQCTDREGQRGAEHSGASLRASQDGLRTDRRIRSRHRPGRAGPDPPPSPTSCRPLSATRPAPRESAPGPGISVAAGWRPSARPSSPG